jgi:hypothetical protein
VYVWTNLTKFPYRGSLKILLPHWHLDHDINLLHEGDTNEPAPASKIARPLKKEVPLRVSVGLSNKQLCVGPRLNKAQKQAKETTAAEDCEEEE